MDVNQLPVITEKMQQAKELLVQARRLLVQVDALADEMGGAGLRVDGMHTCVREADAYVRTLLMGVNRVLGKTGECERTPLSN